MNTLYYGDNLEIMREYIPDESVDLIYLDPPFNSKQAYNIIFRDKEGRFPPSQIEAFDDTWHWTDTSEETLLELSKGQYPPELFQMLTAFKSFLVTSDMMAYLVMMAIRLWEMRRVLKKTGSIYLHCDPTASHYLKVVMDRIFGAKNFQREIIWRIGWVSGFKTKAKNWIRNHDVLLFYTKSDEFTFNKEYIPYPEVYVRRDGKRPTGKGIPIEDTWNCQTGDELYSIMIMSFSGEKLGYPTQKPLKLLERIINASSNEGELVLDPFCGCGTTVVTAEKLRRSWIGIDITVLAINVIEKRIKEHFPEIQYKLIGIPTDVPSARKLAETREGKFLFERWFVMALGGQPYKSSGGGDAGIDGFLYARDLKRRTHRIIISVKGGHYGPADVRDLKGTVEREGAFAGVLLVLNPPSSEAKSEAASAGRVELASVARTFPKVQILTVEEYFDGRRPDLPDTSETVKKAHRIKRENAEGEKLPL